jgi:hypothetical protein
MYVCMYVCMYACMYISVGSRGARGRAQLTAPRHGDGHRRRPQRSRVRCAGGTYTHTYTHAHAYVHVDADGVRNDGEMGDMSATQRSKCRRITCQGAAFNA